MAANCDACWTGTFHLVGRWRMADCANHSNWLTGVRHEGEPEGTSITNSFTEIHTEMRSTTLVGTIAQIDGVECYVATPQADYPKDKVILFLTDVFGIPLINNRVCLCFVTLIL